MKIEFLRLDLHLKRKQKKTTRAAPTCSSEKKEKKKNPEKKVFIREERKKKKKKLREEGVHQRRKKKKTQKQSRGDLGRGATWVRRVTWVAVRPGSIARGLCRRPGSGATWVGLS